MSVDPLLLARTAESEPHGKVTERVETAVSAQAKLDMTAYWRVCGYASEAEYVRGLIMKDLYGSFNRVVSIARRAVYEHPGNSGEKERA